MGRQLTRTSELPALIASVLRSESEAPCVTELVLLCQRMAAAYVRVKIAASNFDPARLGLTPDDFAFDAVADLFRRDSTGTYITWRDMFSGEDPSGVRSEEIEHEVRRQVFMAVNRRIFRSYRETDPGLSKLLRNIKRMLQDHPTAAIVELHGEWWMSPRRPRSLQTHLPPLTPELLVAELAARSTGTDELRDLLTVIAGILADQTEYARTFPVMGISLVIRGLYARQLDEPDAAEISDALTSEELGRFLRPALRRVLRDTGITYVDKGKVTREDLKTYAHTLFDILMEEFTTQNTEGGTFYDQLLRHDPSVSQQEYLEKHRIMLEYLVKLVRREMQQSIKKEWNSLQ